MDYDKNGNSRVTKKSSAPNHDQDSKTTSQGRRLKKRIVTQRSKNEKTPSESGPSRGASQATPSKHALSGPTDKHYRSAPIDPHQGSRQTQKPVVRVKKDRPKDPRCRCDAQKKDRIRLPKKIDFYRFQHFVKDKELRKTLCLDLSFDTLLEGLTRHNIFTIDPSIKVPFFADIRGYTGAIESETDECWIVKPVRRNEILNTAVGGIIYFIDRYCGTLSAPTILARIDEKLYRATKIITRAEQLSGANYTAETALKEQLLLDIINRWIYADEDRNPNNYMIRLDFENHCFPLVIPIDFGNADLTGKTEKIVGRPKKFGWIRREKTQYLTPLKMGSFVKYDMRFYEQRFKFFMKLDAELLGRICKGVFNLCPELNDTESLTETIVGNVLSRIDYVYAYFKNQIPGKLENINVEKYAEMGHAFSKYYC